MAKRGRKSTADRAAEACRPLLPDGSERPDAPDQLTELQAKVWHSIADHMPAGWFRRGSHPLLVQYCRHVVTADYISQLIAQLEKREVIDLKDYDRLLRMAERESRMISSLATKMRITQQATYDPKTAHRKLANSPVAVPPWEFGQGSDAGG